MTTNTELIARLRVIAGKGMADYFNSGHPNSNSITEAADAIEAMEIDRDTLKAEVNFLNAKLAKLNDTHSRLKEMVDDGSIQGRTYSAALEQEKEIARLEAQLAAAQGQAVAWIEWDTNLNEGDPDSIAAGCDKPDLACDGWEWRPLYLAAPIPQQVAEPAPSSLPLLSEAFRTTESNGASSDYRMVFKFKDLASLHSADDEWRKFKGAV